MKIPSIDSLATAPSLPTLPQAGDGLSSWKQAESNPADSLDLTSLAKNLAGDHKAMALFEFTYQSINIVSQSFSGGQVSRTEVMAQSFEMNMTLVGDPEAAAALVANLEERWTPAKVADRITGFALKSFGRKDLPQAPSDFRDLVVSLMEKGYAQARTLLGNVSGEVASGLEETRLKVIDKMNSFAADAPPVPEGLNAPL